MVSRALRVDLTPEMAVLVFSRNVAAAALKDDLEDLWPYRKTNMKHAIDWGSYLPSRQTVHDMFEASNGHLLHQNSLL